MSATILSRLKKSLTAGAEISSILRSNIFHFFIVLVKQEEQQLMLRWSKPANFAEFSTFLSFLLRQEE